MYKGLIKKSILFIALSNSFLIFSQGISFEKRLFSLFIQLENAQKMMEKKRINDSIIAVFHDFLNDSVSFYHSFPDSIPFVLSSSPDKKLKIYSWHVQYTPDDYHYHGFIQYLDKKNQKYRLFSLNENADIILSGNREVYTDTNWYGALYYKIVPAHYNDMDYYTIFGFDYNSQITRKKFIDILTISDDRLLFGKPVFMYQRSVFNRVVFEYSSKAVMTIEYDEKNKQIVFDHLTPSKPMLEGHYEFYGPDLSYDAFEFIDGFWKYKPAVDVRNKKPPKKKTKKQRI